MIKIKFYDLLQSNQIIYSLFLIVFAHSRLILIHSLLLTFFLLHFVSFTIFHSFLLILFLIHSFQLLLNFPLFSTALLFWNLFLLNFSFHVFLQHQGFLMIHSLSYSFCLFHTLLSLIFLTSIFKLLLGLTFFYMWQTRKDYVFFILEKEYKGAFVWD